MELGERFGKLIVVSEAERHHGKRRFRMRCDCGGATISYLQSLRSGRTQSCGCRKLDTFLMGKTHHGMARTRAYRIWSNMKQRCFNERNTRFAHYGGRGITVCDRWLDFANFLDDMGQPPDGTSLDRIDNDGNYEPTNCRWTTAKQQQVTARRQRRYLTHNGETKTIAEWAAELGISKAGVQYRLSVRGDDASRAIDFQSRRNPS